MVKMKVIGCSSEDIQYKCKYCPYNYNSETCEVVREANNLELCWLFYRGKE